MNILLVALIGLLVQAATPQQPRASVEGVVVKMGSGEPVGAANVQLHPEKGRESEIRVYNATTDPDGKFAFNNVAPGSYRLVATRSGGYVPAEYGQRSPASEGIPFELTAGEKMTGVQLAMAPTGSISGRVYDRDGEPLGKAQVQALRPVYRDGRRTLTIVQTVETDDRGEYRLFWLTPGRYYVSAKPDIPELPAFSRSPNSGTIAAVYITEPVRFGGHERASNPVVRKRTVKGEVVEETYLPVYYPGVLETGTASPIVVASGSAIGGVDISVGAGLVRTWHIRGRVINAANGQPIPGAVIMAIPRTSEPLVSIPTGEADSNGFFDVPGATPGSYFMVASPLEKGGGAVPVEVGNADVQNLAIVVATSGFKLSGRFIIDGRSATNEDPKTSDLRVSRFIRDPEILGMPSGGPSFNPPPLADGSFTLEGVAPGDFRVTIRVPPGAYVKSMRMGNADVLEDGLHIDRAPENPLEIVIGANAGRISGSVVDARQEPLPNRIVVLAPDARHRQRSDLYKSLVTDSSGRFQMQGISPGDYELFAWEDIETGAWQDSEYMRTYANRGRPVHITEGSDENLQLTVIR